MIPHHALINALRFLGYKYKTESQRIELYKLGGSTKRVELHKRDFHDNKEAEIILRRAGMNEDELKRFLATTCN